MRYYIILIGIEKKNSSNGSDLVIYLFIICIKLVDVKFVCWFLVLLNMFSFFLCK